MSFMTDRYFQILENHKIYGMLFNKQSLAFFMERHVICAWIYHSLMKNLYSDLVGEIKSINSVEKKECLRLITEMILDEVVEEQGNGHLQSHLELYINSMEEIGANVCPILAFFDLVEKGVDPYQALKSSGMPSEVQRYCRVLLPYLDAPAFQKAAVLFYEGEPYIPDQFLVNLESLLPDIEVNGILDYFESHIEGLKRPGFSASGRLVEVLSAAQPSFESEAEKTAERAMRARLDLWNSIAHSLEAYSEVIGKVDPMPDLKIISGGLSGLPAQKT